MFFHRRHRERQLQEALQPPSRRHLSVPRLRECIRDGSDGLNAACAPLWVSPHFCAFSCVPSRSRPHRSRLSSPGDGAGSRSCQPATCVGARLSRSRPVPIRSQSQKLRDSSRTRRPIGSPGRLRDHFSHICRQTSFGGVLAMMLAVLPPAAVAGVILNDIGPVMEHGA